MTRILAILLSAGLIFLGACADEVEPDEIEAGDAAVAEDTEVTDDFDTLDSNGDSYLDADEIAEWADDAGTFREWDADADSELDTDEIYGNAFELWDADDNGTINEQEWQESAETWYPNDADVIVYSDIDKDGDSEIDADEFAEGFDLSVLGESWTESSFDEDTFKQFYFELYDADENGQVSEDEWTTGVAMMGTPDDA